jgi:hypothetical protein
MESGTPIDAPLNWLECSLKWLGTYKDGFSVVVLLPAGAALLQVLPWKLE